MAWAVIGSVTACHPRRAGSGSEPAADVHPVTHGVASGDVTQSSAVIWARSDRAGTMHVLLRGPKRERAFRSRALPEHDFAAKVAVDGLSAGAPYDYTVWFSAEAEPRTPPEHGAVRGRFRTAPPPERPAPVAFAFGADLGGQNVCRDRMKSYPVFRWTDRRIDFFVGLGDMIYADDACEAIGRFGNPQLPGPTRPATTLEGYWARYKYNRADPGFLRLLTKVPYLSMWDDHEVINDFGPEEAAGSVPPYVPGVSLLPIGRQALFDYHPIGEEPRAPGRLYRGFRWGRHLDLILLDARQYRQEGEAGDPPERAPTMLGSAQLGWLVDRLRRSDATWRVLVSSVALSVPSGHGGRDGWASPGDPGGYEHELLQIFEAASEAGIERLVFLTADIHFATGFVYQPLVRRPEFEVYEIATGPLSAGLFPRRDLDTTFRPRRLFYHGPNREPQTFSGAQKWMTFGRVRISQNGALVASIVNADGEEVYAVTLPDARAPRGRE